MKRKLNRNQKRITPIGTMSYQGIYLPKNSERFCRNYILEIYSQQMLFPKEQQNRTDTYKFKAKLAVKFISETKTYRKNVR